MAYHGEVTITQGSQSISGNYTSVTAKFYAVRDSGYAYSGYTTHASCTLDGTTKSIEVDGFDLSSSNPKVLLGTMTKDVKHNVDGKKTVSASFTWDSENSYVGTLKRKCNKNINYYTKNI